MEENLKEPLIFQCQSADDVLRAVRENQISFVQFWFVDVLGVLKCFQATPSELEMAFDEGMGFDGSSLEGFSRIEESDIVAFPDPTTLQMISWGSTEYRSARMFCDIVLPDGTPYQGDTRYVLKRALARAAEKGYTFS